MAGSLTGHFVAGSKGRILLTVRTPQGGSGDCVIFVPPFAEEMNKCRRMMSLTAQALAMAGLASIVPDLAGTGDSENDFADATWDAWVHDLAASARWVEAQRLRLIGTIGIRLGAALAVSASQSGALPPVPASVFWQPVLDGDRFVQQFLRLRVAASLMAGGPKESISELRTRISGGEIVEVAGYPVGVGLIDSVARVKAPQSLPTAMGHVTWIEVLRGADDPLGPASRPFVSVQRDEGPGVHASSVVGEQFWNSTEIVVLPELVARTVDALA